MRAPWGRFSARLCATIDAYQSAWDDTVFDCPLCGNAGVLWREDGAHNDRPVALRCPCAAGDMLPASIAAQLDLAS